MHFLSRNINYIHLLASIQASFLPIHQHYILPLAAVLLSDILLFVFLGRCWRPIYIPFSISLSSIFLFSSSSIFLTTTSPPILQSPSFPSCTVSWTILLTFTSSQSWYSRVRHHRLLSACFVHQVLDHQPSPRGTFGLLLPSTMTSLCPYHTTTGLSTTTFEVATHCPRTWFLSASDTSWSSSATPPALSPFLFCCHPWTVQLTWKYS